MKKGLKSINIDSYLDIIAILAWAILLFKYWFTGQLYLLIHPNYFILVFVTSIILFILSILKIYQVFQLNKSNLDNNSDNNFQTNLLPKGWANIILIVVAILGLTTKPIVLASQTAMQRGVIDSLPPATQQAESFIATTKPEDKTLIEWVRTLNVYPEPDSYSGQSANIKGFVVHLDKFPDNYLYLSRFILTCCAVDAYPVGIVVELPESRANYSPDSWLQIQGEMTTQLLPSLDSSRTQEKRQLVLRANIIKTIPTPKNPYGY